jgi:hypothetical protein
MEGNMTHSKQSTRDTRGAANLGQAIPGYKGYSGSKVANRTDRIFSEEILSKLSEAVATVSRIKRVAGVDLTPDVMGSLDVIEEKAECLAQEIADTAYDDRTGARHLRYGAGGQVVVLDEAILERVGHINQALSAIDIEGGTGITTDDMESVAELLDDLKTSIKRRESILNSKVF